MSENVINIRIEKLASLGSKTSITMEYTDNNGEYIAIGSEKQKLNRDQVEKEKVPIYRINFAEKQKFADLKFNLDDPKDKYLFDKICQNPFIQCKINKNLKFPQYKLIDVNEKENEDVVFVKKVAAAIDYVRGLSKKSMYELGYYLGFDFSKKNPNQLFLALVGLSDGVIHKDKNWERVQSIDSDPLAYLKLCVTKAMVAGIITKQNDGFYYKGGYTGSNKEEILFHFQNNTSVFENGLVFDVKKWDELQPISVSNEEDESVAMTIDFQNFQTQRHLTTATDIDELKQYAKDNNFRGYEHWKEETLRNKVAEHRKREAEKEEIAAKKNAIKASKETA